MKKILSTTFFAFLTCALISQIKVIAPNGDVGIGTSTPTEKLEVDGNVKNTGFIVEQTNASASCLFNRTDRSAVTMGAGFAAGLSFDEDFNFDFRQNDRASILARSITSGPIILRLKKNNQRVGIGETNPATLLHVNGSITYNGSLNNASDKRLKSNINDFQYGLNEVLALNPVTYQYNGKGGIKNAGVDQIGIIAQDLQKVAPELVKTFTHEEEDENQKVISSEDFLMVSESSIKYMLINAVKEQSELIENQQALIESLTDRLDQLETKLAQGDNIEIDLNGDGAYLKQNTPNPFNGSTEIAFSIPQDAQSATIIIYDINGKVIKENAVNAGKGNLTLNVKDYAQGIYTYSLVVDGEIVETKKMIYSK